MTLQTFIVIVIDFERLDRSVRIVAGYAGHGTLALLETPTECKAVWAVGDFEDLLSSCGWEIH